MAQSWLSPHGFSDLVRLARRGRSTFVRVLYVLALFGALAVVFQQMPTERSHRNQNALVAERFSITILVAQNLAVCILMPIYCAASIQEERDKHTFALLFTTQLTARQIVQGKLLSRIGHVGSVLLAGLPVLSFVQLWGGIDMPMIAANFWNTAMLLLSVGRIQHGDGASDSARCRGPSGATYLILIGSLTCCCAPVEVNFAHVFFFAPYGEGADGYYIMLMMIASAAVVHLLVALWFTYRAAVLLENQGGEAADIARCHRTDEYRSAQRGVDAGWAAGSRGIA